MTKKIKQFLTETKKGEVILSSIILVLVAIGSFLLGRLSNNNLQPGIKVSYPNMNTIAEATQSSSIIGLKNVQNALNQDLVGQNGQNTVNTTNTQKIDIKSNFFASNKGKKYYPVSCSAGKSIKLENRIYFNNSSDAEKAGYELSGSCQ